MRTRIFTEPQQGASYDRQLAMARTAEAEGFDAYFRSDHFLRMGDGGGLPGPTDAWITLAGLARETERIRLGVLVSSATFRLPGPLAVTVAEIDHMSGGRVEMGLGTGWYDEEHRAYGIPFPPLAERFERLEEQLAIVTGLWATAEGGRFTFDGSHYKIIDSPALPKPVQSPRPPVIVGGAGARRTPRLAASYADECNVPFHQPDDVERQFARVRRACEEIGRDPATMTFSAAVVVCVGSDDNEVRRRAAAIGRDVAELKDNGACGTPAQVAERLGAWVAAGATTLYLQVLDLTDLDHVRLIGREVLPKLA